MVGSSASSSTRVRPSLSSHPAAVSSAPPSEATTVASSAATRSTAAASRRRACGARTATANRVSRRTGATNPSSSMPASAAVTGLARSVTWSRHQRRAGANPPGTLRASSCTRSTDGCWQIPASTRPQPWILTSCVPGSSSTKPAPPTRSTPVRVPARRSATSTPPSVGASTSSRGLARPGTTSSEAWALVVATVAATEASPAARRACQLASSGSQPITGRPPTLRVPTASSTPHPGAATIKPLAPPEYTAATATAAAAPTVPSWTPDKPSRTPRRSRRPNRVVGSGALIAVHHPPADAAVPGAVPPPPYRLRQRPHRPRRSSSTARHAGRRTSSSPLPSARRG